jgi:hypothetical protein
VSIREEDMTMHECDDLESINNNNGGEHIKHFSYDPETLLLSYVVDKSTGERRCVGIKRYGLCAGGYCLPKVYNENDILMQWVIGEELVLIATEIFELIE